MKFISGAGLTPLYKVMGLRHPWFGGLPERRVPATIRYLLFDQAIG